jgi:putative chitinase
VISLEQLLWVAGTKAGETYLDWLYPHFDGAFAEFGIDTPLRQVHFLAQTCHETDGFRALEEYASGDAYDDRVDLGNTPEIDGDGRLYKGRGIIMCTGATNYARCSKALFGDKDVLLKDPDILAGDYASAVRCGGWYWEWKKLNQLADANDVVGLTRKINGGTNGLPHRMALTKRAAQAFGLRS